MEDSLPLLEFYKNQTIFITGATGFIGKLLIEKLLRSCPDIKKIYILLRPKKDKEPAKRLKEIFDTPIFEELIKANANIMNKVEIINGDLALANLGIQADVEKMLKEEINIVFHVAATVRLEENLKKIANINLRSVIDLIKMAKNMSHLKAFMYVSTAFSFSNRFHIDEKFYNVPMSGHQLLTIMDCVNENIADSITAQLIHDWKNTYTFTKALAEDFIRHEGMGLPIAIYRPSMIIGCYNEPLPGWIDNLYGPTGVAIGSALGVLRVFHCDTRKGAELVPADYVVNSLIAAAWDVNDRFNKNQIEKQDLTDEERVPIYNYVSYPQKKITWNDFIMINEKHGKKIPSPMALWHYSLLITTSTLLYKIGIFFLHYLPAFIIDFVFRIIGKKPFVVKMYDRVHKFCGMADYFVNNEWHFTNENTQRLWKKLKPSEQEIFKFNMATFNWDDFFKYYIRGCRLYLLKDPLSTVPAGKRKIFFLRIAHYALVSIFIYLLYKLFSAIFHTAVGAMY